MNNSMVRILVAVVVGYGVYAALGFLLGARPDSVGDWVGMAVKGFLVVGAAIYAVEWANRRKQAKARDAVRSDRSNR
ncbi:hypothetical protein [Nocardia sp. NPDC005366]|uniref:hypothetical protein n=1 Tax=Nocardia sp. NPDC005366 TaxID=3156878 RepID=UPI0033AF7ADD